MSKVILEWAGEKRYQEVDVCVGDYVKIAEWDGIEVQGLVKEITENKISLESARFLGGAYTEVDYSSLENKTEFDFILGNVASIEVSTFGGKLNPLTLINEALKKNYCGSDKIIVSTEFLKVLQRFMQDKCTKIYDYPIVEDKNIDGFYVYAVPNESTKKHNITPLLQFEVEFFEKGKGKIATSLHTSFEDTIEQEIERAAQRVKNRFALEKVMFRIIDRNNNTMVIKRGVA